jgi:tripartite ATP-independent transporter DctM subunit
MLILGGILSGFFTATEAGAVSVLYVVLLGVWYGELSSKGLMQELRDSMVETFSLTFIIAVASLYGLVVVQLRLPILMIEGLTGVSENQSIILLMIVMLLLVVGTFMDTTAALTILIPVLMPVIDSVGIDPIHFGIITILTLMIGLLTPPFGVILFVLEKVTDATLEEIFKSIVLYYIPLLIVLVLVIFIPELSTYIPTNLL